MGLSDASAIQQWLKAKSDPDTSRAHLWTFLQGPSEDDPSHAGGSLRAVCGLCGLIRRKPLSRNAEIYIDLSGPCPRDSSYWRERQEERLASNRPSSAPKRRR